MKFTAREIKELKREVKAATGMPMCQFEIGSFGDDFIEYYYYKTNYDKATGRTTCDEIKRKRREF